MLILGPPGVGKTTAIRDVARLLADEYGKRVVVVDTSNEIGGDGDVPHSGIGGARRMQVPQVDRQHEVGGTFPVPVQCGGLDDCWKAVQRAWGTVLRHSQGGTSMIQGVQNTSKQCKEGGEGHTEGAWGCSVLGEAVETTCTRPS